eukprot:CAMPEP_0117460332 /NCGR_PEP_ID=MMETSP0784-20121206/1948_1 /TAXON_ID=39447 /ORGANISM="" /LENGTH=285 /DNA_ID=CAMNT_0005253991 /DNA_START=80 /DNA_END=937 /DNA_ORIENTATION=+
MDEAQPSSLLCAHPECEFLVHSNPSIIDDLAESFCCLKCQGRYYGEDWALLGKRHYKHCEQLTPNDSAVQADRGGTLQHRDQAWSQNGTGVPPPPPTSRRGRIDRRTAPPKRQTRHVNEDSAEAGVPPPPATPRRGQADRCTAPPKRHARQVHDNSAEADAWYAGAGSGAPADSTSQHEDKGSWQRTLWRNSELTQKAQPSVAEGQHLIVQSDFLEYQNDPEHDGRAHNGFLVVWSGEIVSVLYVGPAATEEAGWLFAEVVSGDPPKPTGREGWLPSASVGVTAS